MKKTMFDISFDRVFSHEGGYQVMYSDRGNWTTGKVGVGELRGTKYGISAMSYPTLDIKALTREQAKAIYLRDFWTPINGPTRAPELVYQLFDANVNHGLGNTIKMLQRAIGTKDDGQFGPMSQAALDKISVHDILKKFLAQRLRFMTDVPTWPDYGKGWARRIADNLDYAADDTIG